MKSIYCFALLLLFHLSVRGQGEVILFEDFNDCSLPPGWEVKIEGNQNVHWLVGHPDNPAAQGTSIDGTCMFVVDDDLTGNNTEGYIWSASSPEFSTRGFDRVTFSVDFHFRYTWVEESFRILLSNETNTYTLFETERRNYTDTLFSGFQKITADIAFYPPGEYKIIFEYNDNSRWAWWAGFDNFSVTGDSRGVVLYTETLNNCENPPSWSSVTLSGNHGWQFGYVENPKAWRSKSMNGTCFAYFDDDFIGEDAIPSTVALLSAPVSLTDYAEYFFSFDLTFRQHSATEFFEIGLLVNNERIPIRTYTEIVGGEHFDEYQTQIINLSPYKAENAQIYFLYHDGGGWAWWVGIDNFKLSGKGDINDLCSKAFSLNKDEPLSFDITNAYRDTSIPSDCNPDLNKTLWYVYDNDIRGLFDISITNNFDGVLEIFQGNNCNSLTLVECINRDEYGFYGENKSYDLSGGRYYIRVSAIQSDYTDISGQGNILLASTDSLPVTAVNKDCYQSQVIDISGNAPVYGYNLLNNTSVVSPSDNSRARSDVWFTFSPDKDLNIELNLLSDFSGSLAVYEGTCANLTEISTDYSTGSVLLENLEKDKNYFIQVSGLFSTLEGIFELVALPVTTEEHNTDCINADEIGLDGECIPFSNIKGGFSGINSTCTALTDADRWYSFNAPTSGSIEIRFKSGFLSTVSVLDMDNCAIANTLFCSDDLHFCDGYTTIRNLVPGKKYYIQIASQGRIPGNNRGEGCLYLREFNPADEYEPLNLTVETICASKNAALVMPAATGGSGEYQYYSNNELIASFQTFVAEVEDSDGCIDYLEGIAPDCSDTDCNVAFEINPIDVRCYGESNGQVQLIPVGGLAPYRLMTLSGEGLPQYFAAGTYQCLVSDAAGCSDTITFTIEQPEPIRWELLDYSYNDQTGKITISGSGGTGNLQVFWFKDGEPFADGVWEISISQSGAYHAIITDSMGCSVETDIFDFITSQQHFASHSGWSIYPNPVRDQLNLEFTQELSGQQEIEVLNTTGIVIHRSQHYITGGHIVRIACDHWVPGIYTLIIKDKSGTVSTKTVLKVNE